MFWKHFECMFIEITNNKINNLIRNKENLTLTRYVRRLHDTKKGFQRVSNFVTLMLHFISWGIRPMAFEWAIHSHEYNIMPSCIVYDQYVLRGHWPALGQPLFFTANESCRMSNNISTEVRYILLALITILLAWTQKRVFVGRKFFTASGW